MIVYCQGCDTHYTELDFSVSELPGFPSRDDRQVTVDVAADVERYRLSEGDIDVLSKPDEDLDDLMEHIVSFLRGLQESECPDCGSSSEVLNCPSEISRGFEQEFQIN